MPVPQVRTDIGELTNFRGRRVARQNVLAETMLKEVQAQIVMAQSRAAPAKAARAEAKAIRVATKDELDIAIKRATLIKRYLEAGPEERKALDKLNTGITVKRIGPDIEFEDTKIGLAMRGHEVHIKDALDTIIADPTVTTTEPSETGIGTKVDHFSRVALNKKLQFKSLKRIAGKEPAMTGDVAEYFQLHGKKPTAEELKDYRKSKKAPLKEQLTIYGPKGKTKRVPVERGVEYTPPKGWSLKAPSKEPAKKITYEEDKGKLIDDTEAFYRAEARLMLDPDTGLVRFGPEGNENKYVDEYSKLNKRRISDMVKIGKGELPSWLEGKQAETPDKPDPTLHTGKIIKDTITGERFQSNGTEWVKL